MIFQVQSFFDTWVTQYHAFRHPQIRPPNSNIKVQENRLGHRESIQMPAAMPISVGITTDQPTIPKILNPNSRLWSFSRRAFILRASFDATDFSISAVTSGFSFCRGSTTDLLPQPDESAYQVGLQFSKNRPGLTLPFIQDTELLFDCAFQFTQGSTANGIP